MNIHYFHFINQTLSLELKAHFTAISFQKAVVEKIGIKGFYEFLFKSINKNTLFSFYKPNSIFQTKGAFYGNKCSKSSCFASF